jgi:ACT domain-containing protein
VETGIECDASVAIVWDVTNIMFHYDTAYKYKNVIFNFLKKWLHRTCTQYVPSKSLTHMTDECINVFRCLQNIPYDNIIFGSSEVSFYNIITRHDASIFPRFLF